MKKMFEVLILSVCEKNITASGNPISRRVATSASFTAGVVAGAADTGAEEAVGTCAAVDAGTDADCGATVAASVAVFFGLKKSQKILSIEHMGENKGYLG